MRYTIWGLVGVMLLASGVGCHSTRGQKRANVCNSATCGHGHGGHGGLAGVHGPRQDATNGMVNGGQGMAAGPPSAQVAYPYYTTRGPRDFLLNNPPSIGH